MQLCCTNDCTWFCCLIIWIFNSFWIFFILHYLFIREKGATKRVHKLESKLKKRKWRQNQGTSKKCLPGRQEGESEPVWAKHRRCWSWNYCHMVERSKQILMRGALTSIPMLLCKQSIVLLVNIFIMSRSIFTPS